MWKGKKVTELVQLSQKKLDYGDTLYCLVSGRFKRGRWVGLKSQFSVQINSGGEVIFWS